MWFHHIYDISCLLSRLRHSLSCRTRPRLDVWVLKTLFRLPVRISLSLPELHVRNSSRNTSTKKKNLLVFQCPGITCQCPVGLTPRALLSYLELSVTDFKYGSSAHKYDAASARGTRSGVRRQPWQRNHRARDDSKCSKNISRWSYYSILFAMQ